MVPASRRDGLVVRVQQGYWTDRGIRGSNSWTGGPILLRNLPQQGHSLRCMAQVSAGVGVNLFIDLIAKFFRIPFIYTQPDGCKVVDLNGPDLVIPAQVVRQSVSLDRRHHGNSLGRELAEYLLHNIASHEAVPDIVQGESFQRGDIILDRRHPSFLAAEKRNEKPYQQVYKLTLGMVWGSSPLRLK